MRAPFPLPPWFLPGAAAVLLAASVGLAPARRAPDPSEPCQGKQCAELVELQVRDVVALPGVQSHAVVLSTMDKAVVLPIFVDEGAAIAIALRLLHHPSPLPLTQDLLDAMLTQLGGKLTEVRIDHLEEAAFTAQVLISQGKKRLQLQARASDSIAMALSHGAKIFTSREVLDRDGVTQGDLDQLQPESPSLPEEPAPGVGGSGQDPGSIKL